MLRLTFCLLVALTLTAEAGGRRAYNPFATNYEHRTARLAREQHAPRVMIYGGQLPAGTSVYTSTTTVTIGR